MNSHLCVSISPYITKAYVKPERGRQPFAEGFSPTVASAIADLPLFPAGNQFPNRLETQITQSNLIHCCLSATQPFGERLPTF
ncbi:MAG: hypothetical protein LBG58_11310 [Planctomycetaceae bacterium]|nr:hypothetical protein [Planctomycetaceae bacterium]